MIVRTEETLGLETRQTAGQTRHTAQASSSAGFVGTGITPHIPVWDKSDREDGTFSRSDFTFNRERNVYVCPADKLLKTTGNVGRDHKLRYFLRLSATVTQASSSRDAVQKRLARKVTRDVDEDARRSCAFLHRYAGVR